jgi:folate-binding protein YgfZ
MNVPSPVEIFLWRPAAWLRVTGEDAATFLQGQFTNELRGLKAGEAKYGLWLTLKGKVLADSFVIKGSEAAEFWIGSYASQATIIRERLESHVIADDVAIEDQTDTWAGLTVFGAEADQVAARALAQSTGAGFAFPGRRAREAHVEVVLPILRIEAFRTELVAATALHAAEIERRRIAAGIPAVPTDIGPADLPNEGALETDAISYTKGCYLGQEVMARLKSLGQVRRRLLRVTGPSQSPLSLPVPLFAGGRSVGELRSLTTQDDGTVLGFAMLTLLHLKPDSALALTVDGAPAFRLLDLP